MAQSWISEGLQTSDFTHEEGLEGAGGVVPPETLAVSVPELQAVFRLSVLVPGQRLGKQLQK